MKSPFIPRCLFALVLLLFTVSKGVSQSTDCKEIKAKVEVTDSTPGNDDGEITVILENGPAKFSIHLLQLGKDPKTNLSTLSIGNLSKGKYLVVVSDKNSKSGFCPKAIEVNVK